VGEKHDNKVKGLVGSERLEMMKNNLASILH